MQTSLLKGRGTCVLPRSTPVQQRRVHARAGPAVSKPKIDVVGLGNLCVDVFVDVPTLPPADTKLRRALLDDLTKSCTDRSAWEVGGNTNFMIAASRLGLNTASVGHTGKDIFGEFMDHVLQVSA